jgi:excisionase family DNA binding protein
MEMYSVDQVAEALGLHVRTVRNYVREGRLKAVRIGKQYRIARADLEALTGGAVPAPARETVRRTRHVEVSSIVEIDAIAPTAANRLATTLVAAANSRSGAEEPLRIETVYDEVRARLKVVLLGGVTVAGDALRLIGTLLEADW